MNHLDSIEAYLRVDCRLEVVRVAGIQPVESHGGEELSKHEPTAELSARPRTPNLYHGTYKVYALMKKPRSCVGEISERYSGSVDCNMPTPIPERSLATSHCCQLCANVSAKMLCLMSVDGSLLS